MPLSANGLLGNSAIKGAPLNSQGGGGRDEVLDREAMFSQLAKRSSPRVLVSG